MNCNYCIGSYVCYCGDSYTKYFTVEFGYRPEYQTLQKQIESLVARVLELEEQLNKRFYVEAVKVAADEGLKYLIKRMNENE